MIGLSFTSCPICIKGQSEIAFSITLGKSPFVLSIFVNLEPSAINLDKCCHSMKVEWHLLTRAVAQRKSIFSDNRNVWVNSVALLFRCESMS